MSYLNANDGTSKGSAIPISPPSPSSSTRRPAAAPHDTNFLFDEFTALMDAHKA